MAKEAKTAEWAASTTVFGVGVVLRDIETGLEKEADGALYWSQLPYRNERPGLGPNHYGMAQWNFPPHDLYGTFDTSTFLRGYMISCVVPCPTPRKIQELFFHLGATGSALTSGNNYLALYQNGVKLGQTADQTSLWDPGSEVGVVSGMLTSAVDAAAGDVKVALLANASSSSAGSSIAIGTAIGGTGGVMKTFKTGMKLCAYSGAGSYTSPPSSLASETAFTEQFFAGYR